MAPVNEETSPSLPYAALLDEANHGHGARVDDDGRRVRWQRRNGAVVEFRQYSAWSSCSSSAPDRSRGT